MFVAVFLLFRWLGLFVISAAGHCDYFCGWAFWLVMWLDFLLVIVLMCVLILVILLQEYEGLHA